MRPIPEYSSPVWSPHTKSNIHKIEMVQRRAACRTLCRFSSYDSVSDMLGDLGWRSLEDRHTDSRLCLLYKIVHGLVAVPLPPYVVLTQVLTRHSESHPLAFRQIYTVADYYKHSFFPLTIVQWNRLPPSIALLADIDSFRLAVSCLTHSKPLTGSIVFNFYFCTFSSSDFFYILIYHLLFHSHLADFIHLFYFNFHCTDARSEAHRTPAHNSREGVLQYQ